MFDALGLSSWKDNIPLNGTGPVNGNGPINGTWGHNVTSDEVADFMHFNVALDAVLTDKYQRAYADAQAALNATCSIGGANLLSSMDDLVDFFLGTNDTSLLPVGYLSTDESEALPDMYDYFHGNGSVVYGDGGGQRKVKRGVEIVKREQKREKIRRAIDEQGVFFKLVSLD